MKNILFLFVFVTIFSCKENLSEKKSENETAKKEFVWEGANIYFLLTDRFNNGDITNDINFKRTKEASKLRGFEVGDIK